MPDVKFYDLNKWEEEQSNTKKYDKNRGHYEDSYINDEEALRFKRKEAREEINRQANEARMKTMITNIKRFEK